MPLVVYHETTLQTDPQGSRGEGFIFQFCDVAEVVIIHKMT